MNENIMEIAEQKHSEKKLMPYSPPDKMNASKNDLRDLDLAKGRVTGILGVCRHGVVVVGA
jgi:hypothetical protein